MGVSRLCVALATSAALAAMAALAGCQSYRAAPFDADAFAAAWRDRADRVDGLPLSIAPSATPTTAPVLRVDDGLTLAEGQALALFYNPTLRVARARAGVARATADHAGRWADPTLGVDVERIVSGASDPWVVAGQLSLTLPISGRLAAEQRRAGAEHAAELLRVAGLEWATRHRVAGLWAEWSTQAARIASLDALLARLDAINRITDRLAEAGSLTRIEARLFRIERAARRAERVAAEARAAELRLELLALLGLTPDAPVALVADVDTSPASSPADPRIEATNFDVRVAAAEYEAAERTLAREIRAQYPDLGVGPGFGTDEGDARALLGLSLPLPLWNRNRQGVAEATAARAMSRAQLEAAIETQTSALAVARVQLEAAARQRAMIEAEIAPAADEQAADADRLAGLGEIDAVLLLDAFVRQHESRVRLLDARLAEQRAALRVAEICGDAASGARPVATTSPALGGER